MFSGYGGFERLMSFIGTAAVFGILFFFYSLFGGHHGPRAYEEPEEDTDRILIDAITSGRSIEEIETILRDDPWRLTDERLRGWHPLHVAVAVVCQDGQPLELVELLLDHGADINSRIEPGWDRHKATPLHIAIPSSNIPMVRFLIEHGADVEARDMSGQQPIDLAGRLYNERIREEIRGLIMDNQMREP